MKMPLISVMLDTSHSPIDPYAPLEQFHSREDFRHVATALLMSAFDCGKNANGRAHKFGEIEIRRANTMTCDKPDWLV